MDPETTPPSTSSAPAAANPPQVDPSQPTQPIQVADIVSREKAAELRAGTQQVGRTNFALHRGGSFDVLHFAGGFTVAVVEDPTKLTDEQRGEIAAALKKVRKGK